MNSLRRLLAVFDLFRPDQPVIDVDIICRELGYTPATAYRYLRELGDAGLLKRLPRGYALGPRIVTLEQLMTHYDPLLACSQDLVEQLVADTGLDALVSEWHGDSVVNVLVQRGTDAGPVGGGRGQPISLFHSATSRVVLAHLLPRQIRRVYDAHAPVADSPQPGLEWKTFTKSLLAIRKQGYCVSDGELHPGRSGVAAPIFDDKRRVIGSMTLVGRSERFHAFQQSYLRYLVTGAASELTSRIALR